MMTTKTEENINTRNFSATSEEIAKKLLQGWTMLESVCNICHETPLLKQKSSPHRFCARCNVFIKLENAKRENTKRENTERENTERENAERENAERENTERENTERENSSLSDPANQQKKEEENNEKEKVNRYENEKVISQKGIEQKDGKEKTVEIDKTCFNEIKYSRIKHQNDPAYAINNTVEETRNRNIFGKDEVKYIKEIKLQTGEFIDFLNEGTIPQIETDTLTDLNKYINEKCGNYFTDYLNLEKKEDQEEEKEKENQHEREKNNKRENETQIKEVERRNVETKLETTDSKHGISKIAGKEKLVKSCAKLNKEKFIFAKVKYALMNVLEKYSKELLANSKEHQDVELITKMSQVVTLLEKINNLNKTLTI